MRALILRSLHLPSPGIRPSLLLRLHIGAGDGGDPYRRRTESHPLWRHQDDESRIVKVAVWWDIENCSIPSGVNVHRVVHRITSALRSRGIKGPLTINAFGDVFQLSRATQEALTSTGVCLTHVPHSGKNSSDHFFMADLINWVSHNPPPVHFFLISADKDFANILHRLRMSNYNILLSSTDCASPVLYSAATFMWPWTGLARGEDVCVKHFNHPPDGPYGSWYGYYKGTLDEPFGNTEQAVTEQAEDFTEQTAEAKPRPVPKIVMNGIRQILRSYPEGVNFSELRSELRRCNIHVEKDFFGYKKFSQLLSSMPSIAKIIPPSSGEGQPLVVGIRRKLTEPVGFSSKPTRESEICDGGKDLTLTPEEKKPSSLPPPTTVTESSSHRETDVGTSSAAPTPTLGNDPVTDEGILGRIWRSITVPQSTIQESSLSGEVIGMDTLTGASTPPKSNNVVAGVFNRICNTLTGSRIVHSNGNNDTTSVVESPLQVDPVKDAPSLRSTNHSEKIKCEAKDTQQKNFSGPSSSGSSSLNASTSPSKDPTTGLSEKGSDEPGLRKRFLSQITSWWKFCKHGAEGQGDISSSMKDQANNADGECVKTLTYASCQPEAHDLFSKPPFWHAMGSFLQTDKGSDIILKSGTREQLAHGLLIECLLVKNLKESHLLQLVDLLISEKKWVEESTWQTFPFKPTLPAVPRANGPNGLSSLFKGKIAAQSKLQKLSGDWDGTIRNSCNGSMDVTAPQERKKGSPSREETLSDCQKLLTELLDESPNGFNMSTFKPRFIQKYGYALDYETLGYPKLVSLLQIMPGVKIESSFVLPCEKFVSDSAQETPPPPLSEDKGKKVGCLEEEESSWDELGPMSPGNRSANTEICEEVSYHKASLSEEEFSDSEDDTPLEEARKGEEDSSLMQILDAWHKDKEGGEKERLQATDGLVDCSRSNAQTPNPNPNTSIYKPADLQKLKVRPQKQYSFVYESGDDGKEKLVETILGSLRTPGNSKLHS